MKSFIKLAALSLGLAFCASAHAETYLRITGSTAFRSATLTAMRNSVDMTRNTGSFSNAQTTDGFGWVGTGTYTSSTYAIIRGLIKINGVTQNKHVILKAVWSGSTAGVKDNVEGNSILFLKDDPNGTQPNGSPPNGTLSNTTGTNGLTTPVQTEIPNMDMADNLQSETAYNSVPLTPAVTSLSTAGLIGIIPFAWVTSNGAPAGLTNVTPYMLQQLLSNGRVSASVFTNDPNDATKNTDGSLNAAGTMVFATGRNPLSGTHLNAFGECGQGITGTASQFYASQSATPGWVAPGTILIGGAVPAVGKATNLHITPADATYDAFNDGENGYDSGGRVADQCRGDFSSIATVGVTPSYSGKACFVSYTGEGDTMNLCFGNVYNASGVVGGNYGNGRFLKYNGVQAWGGHPMTTTGTVSVDGANHVTLTGADINNSAKGFADNGFANSQTLVVGQFVKPNGANIPAPAYIVSVDSNTQITIGFWPNPGTSVTPTTVAGTLSSPLTISAFMPETTRNGQYSFWGYGYMYYNSAVAADPDSKAAADAVAKQAATVDYFLSGFPVGYMRAARNGVGKPVFNNY